MKSYDNLNLDLVPNDGSSVDTEWFLALILRGRFLSSIAPHNNQSDDNHCEQSSVSLMSRKGFDSRLPNEFHKDEAAQKGQRSGAEAEKEEITCNTYKQTTGDAHHHLPFHSIELSLLCLYSYLVVGRSA